MFVIDGAIVRSGIDNFVSALCRSTFAPIVMPTYSVTLGVLSVKSVYGGFAASHAKPTTPSNPSENCPYLHSLALPHPSISMRRFPCANKKGDLMCGHRALYTS
jgi:hypothetical protein